MSVSSPQAAGVSGHSSGSPATSAAQQAVRACRRGTEQRQPNTALLELVNREHSLASTGSVPRTVLEALADCTLVTCLILQRQTLLLSLQKGVRGIRGNLFPAECQRPARDTPGSSAKTGLALAIACLILARSAAA